MGQLNGASVVVCLSTALFAVHTAQAAKAPAGPEALQSWASHVVIATVEDIQIDVSSAHFDAGWCNSDWLISVRLSAAKVEKGESIQPGDQLVVLALRPRTRRSILESFAPGGHWPIPARGECVRAYFQAHDGCYRVYLPNGFASPGDYDQVDFWKSQRSMPQAVETHGLRSWWPFGVPLELWALIALIGLPLAAAVGWLSSRSAKRRRLRLIAATTVTVWTILLLTAYVICLDIFHEYGLVMLLGGLLVLVAYAALASRLFVGSGISTTGLLGRGLALAGAFAAFALARQLAPDSHFLLASDSLKRELQLVRVLALPPSASEAEHQIAQSQTCLWTYGDRQNAWCFQWCSTTFRV